MKSHKLWDIYFLPQQRPQVLPRVSYLPEELSLFTFLTTSRKHIVSLAGTAFTAGQDKNQESFSPGTGLPLRASSGPTFYLLIDKTYSTQART